jgi:hypothetical protein
MLVGARTRSIAFVIATLSWESPVLWPNILLCAHHPFCLAVEKLDTLTCHLETGAFVVSFAHVRRGIPTLEAILIPCRDARMQILIVLARALVPTPLDDDEGGCLECALDWALAAPDDSSNNSAHALSNERMGHRLITWLATLWKSLHLGLISTYRGDY